MQKSMLTLLAVFALSGATFVGCSGNDTMLNSDASSATTSDNETPEFQTLYRSSRDESDSDDSEDSDGLRTYRVTIKNLSVGQPLAPPVIATHVKGFTMFEVGKLASRGLEAIAENGDVSLMFNRYSASSSSTDAVNVGMPLTRYGTMVGNFKDYVTFEITGKKHDRLSIAAMLICTNDGFTGLNSVKLPKEGKRVYYTKAYDAGTEYNTENSSDIVDGCSALGAIALAGDPNGNENDAVDSSPHQRIKKHKGTQGNGDLDPYANVIEKKITKVTIELISGGESDHDNDNDDDGDDD